MTNYAPYDFFVILSGILVFLTAATLIGWLLHKRIAPGGSNAAIESLNARITAWWGMVALMSVAFVAGRTGVIILFLICSFAALREFLTLTTKSRADHWALLAAFAVILPGQYYLIWVERYGMYAVFVPVYAFLILPILSALRGESKDFLIRVAETQWALMICVFCASHIPALLTLDIPDYAGRNVLLITFLIVVVQLGDVLQYVWGKLLGRHLVAPNLSPDKTWEGLIGGALSATLIGTMLWWITPFSPLGAALMSLCITVMGFFGGLVMSAIKRDRGIRDWGHAFAGHGGFIDRLDSVVFSAPIFFHLTRYFWSA